MHKVYKNIISSALPQAMNIIFNLILPGLIVVKFGSEINGLVSSTKMIVSYISIVGAGIASAVTQALYKPVAENDIKTIKGMILSANKMFNKYGIIFCIILVFIAMIYPFCLDTKIDYLTIVGLMIVMGLSGASEFFAIGRCRALLYANQRIYVCSLIQAISILCSLLFAIIMILLDANIIVIQLTISCVYVFRAIFLIAYVKKNYPELDDYKREKPISSATSKRKDAMIHQISGLAVTGSQPVILTVIIGLNEASIYSIYNIVFAGLQAICSNLSTAVTTFIGRELALGNLNKTRKLFDAMEFAFYNVCTFIYAVTAIMIVPFVSLYTRGADISYEYPVFAVLFMFASLFYVLKMPANSMIVVAGHFRETKLRAIIEASLTVFLGIVLTMIIGLNGVVIGTGIALGWRCLDTITYANKHILKCTNRKSILRLIRTILIVLLAVCIQWRVCIATESYYSWIMIALLVSLCTVIFVIIISVLFDRESFNELLRIIKNSRRN